MNINLLAGIWVLLLVLCCVCGCAQILVKNDRLSKYFGIAFISVGAILQGYTLITILYIAIHFINKYW